MAVFYNHKKIAKIWIEGKPPPQGGDMPFFLCSAHKVLRFGQYDLLLWHRDETLLDAQPSV